MFFNNQTDLQQKKYQAFLEVAGSLSNLFSDSEIPYLYYRVAEKVFCRAFEADDLSRSDVSADAMKDNIGIGLKTFLVGNNKTFQKVAEFNSDRPLYTNLEPIELVKKVAQLRNSRIEFTENAHGLDGSMYHCVIRDSGVFKVFEESMDKVDIENIQGLKVNKSSIVFNDNIHEYSFLLSKSTLTKRFETSSIVYEFEVDVLKDPLLELMNLFANKDLDFGEDKRILQTIYLPLYSPKEKEVQLKSGINQWNASGRTRHPNEVYIPVPAEIHKNFPEFFPNRDTPFNLKFPDGDISESKICQQGGKALMTKSNRKLGKLILRDGLNLKEGELATYEKLQRLGIDSVRIDKISNSEFEINFSKIGSYEQFKQLSLQNKKQ